jgi:hypothetical protein
MMRLTLLASLGFAALLLVSATAQAATAPSLGAASSFAVLAGSAVTNTGATTINGDVGIYPGIGVAPHYSGFGTVTFLGGGAVHDADVTAQNAQFDASAAYTTLDLANGCTASFAGVKELAGLNLVPGVYCADSFHLTAGTLTLSGLASDTWVFKSASDLIITGGAAAKVVSPSCNVWWRVVSTATFDAGSSLIGNILASTSITLAAGASLSGKAFAQTAEVTLIGNVISACVAPPTVTVTKVSNGAVGPFSFTGDNGFANQTITTATSGVGVVGATQTLTTPGAITTITESTPPANYVLASIVCTGLGVGGSATQDLTTRAVTLDAAATAAGAAISCIFTNNYIAPPPPTAPPTVTVTKVSVGGVGPFSFTGTNGFANQTITTATSGVGVAGATQTLTAPGATTITEAPLPAGYTLTSIVCTGLGAGSFTPDLTTRAVTLNPVAGTAIACTFTNVAQGSITINKVAQGGNRTFNFTSTGTGISPTPFSITTVSGNGSQLFSGLAPGSYTVTETVPVGWNLSTLTCTDPTSNSTGNVGTLTATINLAAGESVSCTFTDNLPPTAAVAIPTLNEWGMIIFMVLVGLMSIYYLRRQKVKA